MLSHHLQTEPQVEACPHARLDLEAKCLAAPGVGVKGGADRRGQWVPGERRPGTSRVPTLLGDSVS